MNTPVEQSGEGVIFFDCQGCQLRHFIPVNRDVHPTWEFNGDFRRPTLSPSILVTWDEPSDIPEEFDDETKNKKHVCHSFIKEGIIDYLPDCTHPFAGRKMQLPGYEND